MEKTKQIYNRLETLKERFSDIKYSVTKIRNNSLIVILAGGFNYDNPSEYMNNVVKVVVGDCKYNELIENYLDNPWVRIIVFNFNKIKFK